MADDDEDIHTITSLVLSKIVFEQRSIQLFKAFSAQEAYDILSREPDIALVLLDVVMEHDQAGLELVSRIRRELKNHLVRIVLRTGEAGQAPMREVIITYDINDYKEKTELTAEKLFVCSISALRSYRDLRELDVSRKSCRAMINASPMLALAPNLEKFASEAFAQLKNMFPQDALDMEALWACGNTSLCQYHVVAAIGPVERYKGLRSSAEFSPMINRLFRRVQKEGGVFSEGKVMVAFFPGADNLHQFIYFRSERELSILEKELAWTFLTHVGVFSKNLDYRNELKGLQDEILHILCETMEHRSRETGYHVMRIAAYADLLARELGLDSFERELLSKAAPLHDVGKIGIPDLILSKPAPYTDEEYTLMKAHCEIGRDILSAGEHPVFKAARVVAYEHHERWDGSGYPRGLARQDIHIFGRIVALADVFDALSMKRCYKEAWPMDNIIQYLKGQKNLHFDGELVDIFLNNIDEVMSIRARWME